jgi:hypothetical protein
LSALAPPSDLVGSIPLADYANLTPAEAEHLARVVAEHRGLDDVVAWGRKQSPPARPVDVIKQDEFTHDVLVPFPNQRWLVYGTT